MKKENGIKNKLESFFKNTNPAVIRLGAVLLGFLLLVIILNSFTKTKKSKVYNSLNELEEDFKKAVEIYYKKNPKEAPEKNSDYKKIELKELQKHGYLTEFNFREKNKCDGYANTIRTSRTDFYVSTYINCGTTESSSVKLADKIKKDNPVLKSGSEEGGLYDLDTTKKSSGLGSTNNPLTSGYVFKGRNPNNYLKIDNKWFRILKIDGEGDIIALSTTAVLNIRTPWDDSYNKFTNKNTGYNDYKISLIKEKLDERYQTIKNDYPLLAFNMVSKDFCIGSRAVKDMGSDGVSECKETYNAYIAPIAAFDYLNASLSNDCIKGDSPSCADRNYLSNKSSWTSSAVRGTTDKVIKIGVDVLEEEVASKGANVLMEIALNKNTLYLDGNGSMEKPYLIK